MKPCRASTSIVKIKVRQLLTRARHGRSDHRGTGLSTLIVLLFEERSVDETRSFTHGVGPGQAPIGFCRFGNHRAPSWKRLGAPARSRCQRGAPYWTNDVDAGEDRRRLEATRRLGLAERS